MKIGVFAVLYGGLSLPDMLEKVKSFGLSTVEIGCGGFPGKAHCDPEVLLADPKKLDEFKRAFQDAGVEISALSVHGNALHPNPEIARSFHEDWRNACRLAEKLGISIINTFSGCPGDSENSKYPNWVTCSWPTDFLEILKWQWEEKIIPYWQEESKFALDHGVDKIAFEMHPGFAVYNVDTLLKLREAVGETIGANFDPSHLVGRACSRWRPSGSLANIMPSSTSTPKTPMWIPSTQLLTVCWTPKNTIACRSVPGCSGL